MNYTEKKNNYELIIYDVSNNKYFHSVFNVMFDRLFKSLFIEYLNES